MSRPRLHSGHAPEPVDVLRSQRGIGVGDPTHLARAGREVRRRHVETRTDEVLFIKFEGEAAGDALELALRVLVGRNLDPSLGTAKRHIDDRALVRHERGQRHHLVFIHHFRVSNAALGGQHVVAVLRPPGVQNLDLAAVPFDREGEVDDSLIWLRRPAE